MILIILKTSNFVDDLIQPLFFLSLIFSSSVYCTNIREYAFWIFSSSMYLCFTYLYTSILNNMASKSFYVVVEGVTRHVGLGMVY